MAFVPIKSRHRAKQLINLADCTVREVFVSGEHKWRPTSEKMTAQELADSYIGYIEHK